MNEIKPLNKMKLKELNYWINWVKSEMKEYWMFLSVLKRELKTRKLK